MRRKISQEDAEPLPGTSAQPAGGASGGEDGDGDGEHGGDEGRSASEFECASCDGSERGRAGPMSPSTRRQLDEALDGLAGAGPMTEEDRRQQRRAEREERRLPGGGADFRVGLLRERRERELMAAVLSFLASQEGCAGLRLNLTDVERGELWACVMGCPSQAEVELPGASLGSLLQRLKERVSGAVEQDEEERWRAERDLERMFRKESSWPALKFECSMLQTRGGS